MKWQLKSLSTKKKSLSLLKRVGVFEADELFCVSLGQTFFILCLPDPADIIFPDLK